MRPRTVPVIPDQAFRASSRGARSVGGRDATHWTATAGQARILEPAGGGSVRETVISVDEPHSWACVITDFRGPLAALLTKIDGVFLFSPAGIGTRITLFYNMFPRSPPGGSGDAGVRLVLARLCTSDARELSNQLID